MKFQYFPDTDTLYIRLSGRESVDSGEIAPNVVADYDSDGGIVGLEIEHASTTITLANLETQDLPLSNISLSA